MKVKFMTMSQCKRIIEAGFVGEHDRNGNQVDYADYAEEIQEHYWELRDSRLSEYVMNQYNSVVETVKGIFNMRSIALMVVLLASSNLSAEVRTEKFIAGYKCPNGYYFRLSDRLCHFAGGEPISVKSVNRKVPVKIKVAHRVVAVKPLDCAKVMRQVNQCSL